MSDRAIKDFYAGIYADLTVDQKEAAKLTEFLTNLNPPPDKLTKLRTMAFTAAVTYLSTSDNDQNIQLLRIINFVVHAIEQTCMNPKDQKDNAVEFNEDTFTEFLKGILDSGNAVDTDENEGLLAYFQETNPPKQVNLVATRAHIFKVACDYLSNDMDANTQLLRSVNAIVHAFELSCYLPNPYNLEEPALDLSSMDLNAAVQHLWDIDVNRLTPGDDYEINVQRGKKPFQVAYY